MAKPFFSIVIPTCDRAELLEENLKTCQLMTFKDIEIIVSDNFSSPKTREVVESLGFSNVHYYRTSKRLSMPDNWEFAWSHVKGEYAIFTGDDDVLLPDTLTKAYEIIKNNKAEIVIWNSCLYYHPDWVSSIKFGEIPTKGNILELYKNSNTGFISQINVDHMIKNYTNFNFHCFPNIHNFCFSTKLGKEVESKTGRLFWPMNPDYTSALLMLGFVNKDKVFWRDHLGSCGGRSINSNAASFYAENKKREKTAFHTFKEEFAESDLMPNHPYKLMSLINSYAAGLSLAKAVLPTEFSAFNYDPEKLLNLIADEFNSPFRSVHLDAPEAKDMFLEMQKEIGYFPLPPLPAKIKYFTKIKHSIWQKLRKIKFLRKIKTFIQVKNKENKSADFIIYEAAAKIQIDMDYYKAKSLSEVVPHIEKLNYAHKDNVFGNLLESIKFGIIKNIYIKY